MELPSFASVLEKTKERLEAMNSVGSCSCSADSDEFNSHEKIYTSGMYKGGQSDAVSPFSFLPVPISDKHALSWQGCESDTPEANFSGSIGSSRNTSSSPMLSAMSSDASTAGWCNASIDTPALSPRRNVISSAAPSRSLCKADAEKFGGASNIDMLCAKLSESRNAMLSSLSASNGVQLDARGSLSPLSLGNQASARAADMPHTVTCVKEEKILGANRVGGVDWVQRRRSDSLNQAYQQGSSAKKLQVSPSAHFFSDFCAIRTSNLWLFTSHCSMPCDQACRALSLTHTLTMVTCAPNSCRSLAVI
jgi:hypothetical protein